MWVIYNRLLSWDQSNGFQIYLKQILRVSQNDFLFLGFILCIGDRPVGEAVTDPTGGRHRSDALDPRL